jgi:hypothetical protein
MAGSEKPISYLLRFVKTTADTGWVMMNNSSIGDASASTTTTRPR